MPLVRDRLEAKQLQASGPSPHPPPVDFALRKTSLLQIRHYVESLRFGTCDVEFVDNKDGFGS